MKHIATLFLLVCSIAASPLRGQVLVSDSLIETMTVAELLGQGVGGASFDIEVYRVIYNTVDAHGQPTIASGAAVLPIGEECYHPIAAYMHGTILNRSDVPSRLSNESRVGYFLGGTGYVAALPDYLGLGDGPGPHPYVHARSEATASIDMLRATRELCAQKGIALNGQVFLTGYSQGGHACMATHKMIQEEFPDEFNITASAPCSGPYDVSGVQAAVMVSPDPYPAPYYLPYIIFAYGHVYPWLYTDVGEVIKEPWATLLPPLFQGNNGSGVVDAVMPEVPSQILQDSVLQAFMNDPDHPMRLALRDNDLYDWAPTAPMRMYYCNGDSHVFPGNSLVARDAMHANGATHVEVVDMGNMEHGDCAFPALFAVKQMFDGLKGDCSWNGIDEVRPPSWSLHPNPAHDQVWVRMPGVGHARVDWRLLQTDGRVVAAGSSLLQDEALRIELPATVPGMYLLQCSTVGMRRTLPVVVE
jgi:hypothetical protein